MQETLTLMHPIMVNNQEYHELTYDMDEITVAGFMEAEAKRRIRAGRDIGISPSAQFDAGLQLYMGFAAIIAVNPSMDYADVERIHGMDLVSVMDIGARFLLKSEGSTVNKSEKPSEVTPEPLPAASKNSNENA